MISIGWLKVLLQKKNHIHIDFSKPTLSKEEQYWLNALLNSNEDTIKFNRVENKQPFNLIIQEENEALELYGYKARAKANGTSLYIVKKDDDNDVFIEKWHYLYDQQNENYKFGKSEFRFEALDGYYHTFINEEDANERKGILNELKKSIIKVDASFIAEEKNYLRKHLVKSAKKKNTLHCHILFIKARSKMVTVLTITPPIL